ncbi:MAG: trypsin-like peptidase domain-containing protein [Alphaproteobacteria bacterium]|nr:trypsin-like peptidase domain-containing protein [Alphaproteobacteria bacterium]
MTKRLRPAARPALGRLRRSLSGLLPRLALAIGLAVSSMAAAAPEALAQGKPGSQPIQSRQRIADFYLVNQSPMQVNEIYVSPVEDRNWGQDRLGRNVLPSGQRFLIRLPRDGRCVYDIRVVYGDGQAEERRRQDLCQVEQMVFAGRGGANGAPPQASGKPGTQRAAPSGGLSQVVVENRSGRLIEQLYVSPVTDDNWGRDRLGQDVLPNGRRFVVRLDGNGCDWDLMAVFQGGEREELRRQNLCQTPTVAFAGAAIRAPQPDSGPSATPAPGRRPDAGASSYGTGFFVSPQGHILTNKHVIQTCRQVNITLNGRLVPAQIVASDRQQDLALLRVNMQSPDVASFRAGRRVRAGEEVVVAGYPLRTILADEMNVTMGNVSALAGIGGDAGTLQMTAPVQPGNSGGPLFDMSGNIVGVVVAKLNARLVESRTGDIPQNINFAIHAAEARRFLGENGVQLRENPSDRDLRAADVGDIARRITVPISCR